MRNSNGAPESLRHAAMMYDDTDVVAARLCDEITRDLDAGAAVLMCVPSTLSAQIVDGLDPPEGRVRTLVRDDRYAHPAHAMQLLWERNRSSAAEGAAYLHSIGEISFAGDATDARWHWYESAVNDVFGGTGLRATCLFDTRTLPDDVLESALATHPFVFNGTHQLSGQYNAPSSADRPPLPLTAPSRPEDRLLAGIDNTGIVRRTIRELGTTLPPDVLAAALLVASELGSNAIRHGDGTADVRLWFDNGRVELEVSDHGPGVTDPYALLRPPDLPWRGAGLWLAHLSSLAMSLEQGAAGGTVARAVVA